MSTVDELRRIIRRLEGARPRRPAPEPAEKVLGGELIETGHGVVARVRHAYALSHRHGRLSLAAAAAVPLGVLELLGRADDRPRAPSPLLFLDAETTGLAGGTGTYAFLVGAGYVDGDAFVVEQYFLRDFDDEPALLAALRPLLERTAAVVTFNGTGFDLPLLETRFVLGRGRWPDLRHVDLLAPARRVWSTCLADCRLATLEREVLGVLRDGDVAGHEIPGRFFGYLRHRNAAVLGPVFTHNRDDVLSLVALLGWFATALTGAAADLTAEELAGLGRFWERTDPERGLDCYRAALAAGLPETLAQSVRLRLAAWEKRRARWEAACALWEAATGGERFDPRPWEELAKFHEHRRRDVDMAHRLVTAALVRAQTAGVSTSVLSAFRYRLDRLDRRRSAPG